MVTGFALLLSVTIILWLAPGQSLPSRRATSDVPEESGPPQDMCDEAHDQLFCGSNDVTFLNMCEFQAAVAKDPTIKIVDNGACPCDPKESHEWDPICAGNGQSYANNCELEKARKDEPSLHVRHLGLCNSLMKRDTITFRELQKVKLWSSFMPKELFESLSSRDLYGGGPKARLTSKHKTSKNKKSFGKNPRDRG